MFSSVDGQNGNCWGDGTRACGVFIQGDGTCEISSNELWWAYQNIVMLAVVKSADRGIGLTGCYISINYVSTCTNW